MQAAQLKPGCRVFGSARSSFSGVTVAFQRLNISQQAAARSSLVVQGEWAPSAATGRCRSSGAAPGSACWRALGPPPPPAPAAA